MNKEIEILVEDQLIPIKNNDGRTVVNARDLHEFLESRKDFSSWIKDRIERYDLVENEDYVILLPQKVSKQVEVDIIKLITSLLWMQQKNCLW